MSFDVPTQEEIDERAISQARRFELMIELWYEFRGKILLPYASKDAILEIARNDELNKRRSGRTIKD